MRDALPDYAKDIKLNLSALANETRLSDQQKWGAFPASTHAVGVPRVVAAIEAETVDKLAPEAATAARAAAAIMGITGRSTSLAMKNIERCARDCA